MIKVLKEGEYPYKGTCPHCGCEILAQQVDIKADGRPCAEPYIECPTKRCPGRIDPKPCK